MKKNTVKKIAGIATAATMAVSAATATTVTAFASGSNNNRTTVSFEACGNYGEYGAKMEAYFFNSQNSQNTTVELRQNDGKLTGYVPTGYDKVVFMRKSPDGKTIWNQTYDLDVHHNETFKATGFEGSYYVGYWQ